MIVITKPVRRVRVYSRCLLPGLCCLLLFVTGCSSDEPECLAVWWLPQCFDDGGGDEEVANETRDEVNGHADDIDASVAAVRDAIAGVDAATRDAVNGHLDSITADTADIRGEVENREDGFRTRVDDLTDDVTTSTADIRTAIDSLDASTRDAIGDHLDDIDASATSIDDTIRDDCERIVDDDSCQQIGV